MSKHRYDRICVADVMNRPRLVINGNEQVKVLRHARDLNCILAMSHLQIMKC